MHRCVLSYALPARARRVPLSVRTGISRIAWPLNARTRRTYSTVAEESRRNGSYQPFQEKEEDVYADGLAKTEADESSQEQLDDGSEESTDSDAALEFLLQGYESQPQHFQSSENAQTPEPKSQLSRSPLAGRQQSLDHRSRTGTRAGVPRSRRNREDGHIPSNARQAVQGTFTVRKLRPRPRLEVFSGRPKHVSLLTKGPRGRSFRTAWNTRFARIQNLYDRDQIHDSAFKDPPELHHRTQEWIEIVRECLPTGRDLSLDAISKEHGVLSDTIWMNVALWLVQHDKDLLLEFLLHTVDQPNPPGPWIADCLTLLAIHYRQHGHDNLAPPVTRLTACFGKLATNLEPNRMTMDGRFFRMLIPFCNVEQVNTLYQALKTGSIRVHWQSYVTLASYFAKNEHFHQGLDAVLEAHRAGADLSSPAFRSVCATLLRKSMEQPGGLRACLRIVDNLVKIGLPLNTQLSNIIILNAVEAGDLKTAFAIYHSLVEHSVHADKYTYAILLKGCKQDMNDTETMLSTIRAAIAATDVLENPVLATEILHCLAVHHTNHNRETAWPTICQAYAQLFDLQPLHDLDVPIPPAIASSRPTKPPLAPPPQALSIMLNAHLSLLPLTPSSFSLAHTLYTTYLDLTSTAASTSPFHALATSDHVPNAFLALFTRHPRTLILAARIIKDMQTLTHLPAPTVQSWSIFLHGFTRHGQMKLAEQVLNHMHSKSLEPNEVTWNSLLGGYAAQQDLDGLVDAVGRAEKKGLVWSEFTRGSVGRFRDREGLGERLRRRREEEVELDFTSDLREGLVGRLQGDGGGEREVRELVEGRNV